MLKFANCLFRMLTRSLFTHCISQNNELGSFAVLEIKYIQWIRLDDYVGTICLTRDLYLERFARNISAKSLWVPSHWLWTSCFYWTWELRPLELTWTTVFRMVDGLSYALCTYHVWYMTRIFHGFRLTCVLIVICMLLTWNPQNKHNDRISTTLKPLRNDLCSSVYLSHVAV